MKGLDLSKRYFHEICLPKIKEKMPEILPLLAAGLVGEGSECFLYDDDISVDHDFGPLCCFWLEDKDYNRYGEKLSSILNELPKEFLGFKEIKVSEWGNDRRGVLNIDDFYFKFIGKNSAPITINEWRVIPETALANVTNGEVFLDNLGVFSEIRKNLLDYYPEDIRLNKIATRCMNISQSGQYNFSRSLIRNELISANLALSIFIEESMHLIYLLNRKYKLFYKWLHRGIKDLPILGSELYDDYNDLLFERSKVHIVNKICKKLTAELNNQFNLNLESDFLGDYGTIIQQKIKDINLKNWSPWLD